MPMVEPDLSTSICEQCQMHQIDDEDGLDHTTNATQAGRCVSQPWLDPAHVGYK